jgi:hypothetical protein
MASTEVAKRAHDPCKDSLEARKSFFPRTLERREQLRHERHAQIWWAPSAMTGAAHEPLRRGCVRAWVEQTIRLLSSIEHGGSTGKIKAAGKTRAGGGLGAQRVFGVLLMFRVSLPGWAA